MADKTILTDCDQLADKGMRLNATARADHRASLDFGKGSDETIIADFAAIEVAGLDDFDSRAEFDVTHAALMPFRLVQGTTPSLLNPGMEQRTASWPILIAS